MNNVKQIAALAAGISLSVHAGTRNEDAAIAEAMAQLDSAKVLVTQAYAPNHMFPPTPNSPLPAKLSSTRYVRGIHYSSAGNQLASVVVALSGTGTPILDGSLIGVFGTGQSDGTVIWMCGTAAAMTALTPGAKTALYPYLPAPCQH
jgi:type IV pilus assembly protein PilA